MAPSDPVAFGADLIASITSFSDTLVFDSFSWIWVRQAIHSGECTGSFQAAVDVTPDAGAAEELARGGGPNRSTKMVARNVIIAANPALTRHWSEPKSHRPNRSNRFRSRQGVLSEGAERNA